MHKRTIGTLLAAVVAAAVLAVPAFAQTYQVNVTIKDGSCTPALLSVKTPNTSILFHVINDGTIAHGLLIWGVKSGMVKPQASADIGVNFHKAGTFHFACTTGSYFHPVLFGKGVFKVRG
jgi:Cupredoxin-like domain